MNKETEMGVEIPLGQAQFLECPLFPLHDKNNSCHFTFTRVPIYWYTYPAIEFVMKGLIFFGLPLHPQQQASAWNIAGG